MKKSLVFILGLLFAFNLYAADAISPKAVKSSFRGTVIKKMNEASAQVSTASYGAAEGLLARKLVKVTYDVAVNGGVIGAHVLSQKLPAKAIITRSYFQIGAQFVDGGSGTVALSCEDANNIKTATDITGSSPLAFVEGASTGAASAFIGSIAAECSITATVAGADQTAGSLTAYVEYVVGR